MSSACAVRAGGSALAWRVFYGRCLGETSDCWATQTRPFRQFAWRSSAGARPPAIPGRFHQIPSRPAHRRPSHYASAFGRPPDITIYGRGKESIPSAAASITRHLSAAAHRPARPLRPRQPACAVCALARPSPPRGASESGGVSARLSRRWPGPAASSTRSLSPVPAISEAYQQPISSSFRCNSLMRYMSSEARQSSPADLPARASAPIRRDRLGGPVAHRTRTSPACVVQHSNRAARELNSPEPISSNPTALSRRPPRGYTR